VRRQHGGCEGPLRGQHLVLLVVVAQDELGDVLRHQLQGAVPLVSVEDPVGDEAVEHDLDVDLVVAAVDSGGVVDRVGVKFHPLPCGLDPSPLGEAEVAALADDADAQASPVDPNRVIGLVPDLTVRLRRSLDVGADPAVPEQVHGRLRDRADEVVWAHRRGAAR